MRQHLEFLQARQGLRGESGRRLTQETPHRRPTLQHHALVDGSLPEGVESLLGVVGPSVGPL